MAWRDATVPVVMALLAQWWFASCPTRRELVVAFVIVSWWHRGDSEGVGSRSRVIGCLAGPSAGGLDPDLRPSHSG